MGIRASAVVAAMVVTLAAFAARPGLGETQIPGAAGDADYWPPGYVPLAEFCPEEGDIHAEWATFGYDDPDSIGDVEFRRDGTSVWSKHGTIPFRIAPGEWNTPVLELLKPLGGLYRDQGPYVAMIYPYLSWKGSAGICHMYLFLCKTLGDAKMIAKAIGYGDSCEGGYDFLIHRP